MTRKNKGIGSVVRDASIIFSKLPWWGALSIGIFSFVMFYFFIPNWLSNNLGEKDVGYLKPMFEVLYTKHINKFEWLGIACGLIGLYFTVRNYLVYQEAEDAERDLVGMLAKLLSRKID